MRRPNVVNRKLSGAVIRLERAFPSELNLLDQTDMTVGELPEPLQEGGVSRVLVRELIPRGSGVTSHELVVVGMCRYVIALCVQGNDSILSLLSADCRRHSVSFMQLKLPNKVIPEVSEAKLCPEVSYQFVYEEDERVCRGEGRDGKEGGEGREGMKEEGVEESTVSK